MSVKFNSIVSPMWNPPNFRFQPLHLVLSRGSRRKRNDNIATRRRGVLRGFRELSYYYFAGRTLAFPRNDKKRGARAS